MTILQRIAREPNVILGVIAAGLSLAVLYGADITKEQMAGIGIFIGSLFGLVRLVSTPAAEVVAQQKPGQVVPTAGPASDVDDGAPVHIVEILGKA